MEKQILSENKNIKKILVTFGQEEIDKAENEIIKEVNTKYTFEGFRKGKTPKAIIKMRMGEDFNLWVEEDLLHTFMDKLEEEERLLFPPDLDSKSHDNGKYEFELTIHTYPKVLKSNYEEMVVEVPESKEVVEKYIEDKKKELLEDNSILEPKDGPGEIGDFVRVLYTVVNDEGKTLQENKEQEFTLAEEDKRPIVQNVIGKSKDDVVEFDNNYNEKTYKYTVKVDQIYKKSLPELNDEFLENLGSDIKSLNELEEKLSAEGKEMFEKWNQDYVKNYIINELPEYVEIEIAEESIQQYKETYFENIKKDGKYEEELKKYESEEKFVEDVEKSATRWMKELAITEKISQENDITVTEEEIQKSIAAISQMWYMPVERAREVIYSNNKLLNEVVWDILKSKVADSIKDKVTIKEVEQTEEHDHQH